MWKHYADTVSDRPHDSKRVDKMYVSVKNWLEMFQNSWKLHISEVIYNETSCT